MCTYFYYNVYYVKVLSVIVYSLVSSQTGMLVFPRPFERTANVEECFPALCVS